MKDQLPKFNYLRNFQIGEGLDAMAMYKPVENFSSPNAPYFLLFAVDNPPTFHEQISFHENINEDYGQFSLVFTDKSYPEDDLKHFATELYNLKENRSNGFPLLSWISSEDDSIHCIYVDQNSWKSKVDQTLSIGRFALFIEANTEIVFDGHKILLSGNLKFSCEDHQEINLNDHTLSINGTKSGSIEAKFKISLNTLRQMGGAEFRSRNHKGIGFQYSLFAGETADRTFSLSWNVAAPMNAYRTYFGFDEFPQLESYLRTAGGQKLFLQPAKFEGHHEAPPAGFSFAKSAKSELISHEIDDEHTNHLLRFDERSGLDHYLRPSGTYEVINRGFEKDPIHLMYKMLGTEYLFLQPKDILCFVSDKGKSDAQNEWITSWATVISGKLSNGNVGAGYCKQPDHSAFFDNGPNFAPAVGVILKDLSKESSAHKTAFPLFPLAGIYSPVPSFMPDTGNVLALINLDHKHNLKDLYDHESQLNHIRDFHSKGKEDPVFFNTDNGLKLPDLVRTSNGLLVELNDSSTEQQGTPKRLYLAKGPIEFGEKYFTLNPSKRKVIDADLTINLLTRSDLIIVTDKKMVSPITAEVGFGNEITLGDFPFELEVGFEKAILLFKLESGKKLVDLIEEAKTAVSLQFLDPEDYTEYYNADDEFDNLTPTLKKIEEAIQIAENSQKADSSTSETAGHTAHHKPAFGHFLRIINDPNWTGFLVLNCPINYDALPADIATILGGIRSETRISAHHIGSTINRPKPNVPKNEPIESSALFSVIYYENKLIQNAPNFKAGCEAWKTDLVKRYQDNAPVNPIDFETLRFEVLFENSKQQLFTTRIALTTPELFGGAVKLDVAPDIDSLPAGTMVVDGRRIHHPDTTGSFVFEWPENRVFKYQKDAGKMSVLQQLSFFNLHLKPVSKANVLEAGDQIKISIEGHDDLTVKINKEGKVELPDKGTVLLKDLSVKEAILYLKQKFSNPTKIDLEPLKQLKSLRASSIFEFECHLDFFDKTTHKEGPLGDLFSYNALTLDAYGLNTTVVIPKLGMPTRDMTEDLDGTRIEVSRSKTRTNSLVNRLPLTPSSIYKVDSWKASSQGGWWVKGLVNKDTVEPIPQSEGYALEFDLPMGTTGGQDKKPSHLTARICFAWSAKGPIQDDDHALWFGLQSDNMKLQGIMRTSIDDVRLKKEIKGKNHEYSILLENYQLHVFGHTLPANRSSMVLKPDAAAPKGKLAWVLVEDAIKESKKDEDSFAAKVLANFPLYIGHGDLPSKVDPVTNSNYIATAMKGLLGRTLGTTEDKEMPTPGDKLIVALHAILPHIDFKFLMHDNDFYGGRIEIREDPTKIAEADMADVAIFLLYYPELVVKGWGGGRALQKVWKKLDGAKLEVYYKLLKPGVGVVSANMVLPNRPPIKIGKKAMQERLDAISGKVHDAGIKQSNDLNRNAMHVQILQKNADKNKSTREKLGKDLKESKKEIDQLQGQVSALKAQIRKTSKAVKRGAKPKVAKKLEDQQDRLATALETHHSKNEAHHRLVQEQEHAAKQARDVKNRQKKLEDAKAVLTTLFELRQLMLASDYEEEIKITPELILGNISLAIFVGQDVRFRVALGWPISDNPFQIILPPKTGGKVVPYFKAGLYFAFLSPEDLPGTFGAPGVPEFGNIFAGGLALAYGKKYEIEKLPFKFSASYEIAGELQFYYTEAGDYTGGDYYWVLCKVSLTGSASGSVNLVIINLSFSLKIVLSLAFAFEKKHSTTIECTLDVKATASVRILFITIHVSFHKEIPMLGSPWHLPLGSNDPEASVKGPSPEAVKWPLFPEAESSVDNKKDKLNKEEQDHGKPVAMRSMALESSASNNKKEALTKESPVSKESKKESDTAHQQAPKESLTWIQELENLGMYHEQKNEGEVPEPVTIPLHFIIQTTAAADQNGHWSPKGIASLLIDIGTLDVDPKDKTSTDFSKLAASLYTFLVINYEKVEETLEWNKPLSERSGHDPNDKIPLSKRTWIDRWMKELHFEIAGIDLNDSTKKDQHVAVFPMLPDHALQYGGNTIEFTSQTKDILKDYFEFMAHSLLEDMAKLQVKFDKLTKQSLPRTKIEKRIESAARTSLHKIAGNLSRILLSGSNKEVSKNSNIFKGLYAQNGQQFDLIAKELEVYLRTKHNLQKTDVSEEQEKEASLVSTRISPETVYKVDENVLNWDDQVWTFHQLPPIMKRPKNYSLSHRLSWGEKSIAPFADDLRLALQLRSTAEYKPWLIVHDAVEKAGQPHSLDHEKQEPWTNAQPALLLSVSLHRVFKVKDGKKKPLAKVVELVGTDEAGRTLLGMLIQEGSKEIKQLSFLHKTKDKDETKASFKSLSTEGMILVKTNLSTATGGATTGEKVANEDESTKATYFAKGENKHSFLRLVWEASVVHTGGFFLRFENENLDTLFGSNKTIKIKILVETGTSNDKSSSFELEKYHNAIVGDEPKGHVFTTLAKKASEIEIEYDYVPTHHFGELGLEIIDKEPKQALDAHLDADAHVRQIYHVFSCKVAGQNKWSHPIHGVDVQGATDNERHYHHLIPMEGATTKDRYKTVGTPIAVRLNVADSFGNVPPKSSWPLAGKRLELKALYNDPIIAIGHWAGTRTSYRVDQENDMPYLEIDLSFNKNLIVNSEDKKQGAEQLALISQEYLRIQAQLADENLFVSVISSLIDPQHSANEGLQIHLKEHLAAYVDGLLEWFADSSQEVEMRTSLKVPLEKEYPTRWTWFNSDTKQNVSAGDLLELSVNLIMERKSSDSDIEKEWFTLSEKINEERDIRKLMPSAKRVSSSIQAEQHENKDDDKKGENVAAGPEMSLRSFAIKFENAYADFAGEGSRLKISTGINSDPRSVHFGHATISAMRWANKSKEHGVSVERGQGDPLFSAPLPMNRHLITRMVDDLGPEKEKKAYSSIDLDRWAAEFLSSVEDLFDPSIAPKIANMPSHEALEDGTIPPQAYYQLAESKRKLATTIKTTLDWIYQGDYKGDKARKDDVLEAALRQAEETMLQALLTSLDNDYGTAVIAQLPMEISLSDQIAPWEGPLKKLHEQLEEVKQSASEGEKDVSEKLKELEAKIANLAPNVYGPISLRGAEEDAEKRSFSFSNAKLPLRNTTNQNEWLNFLVHAKNPSDQNYLEAELDFPVNTVEHNFRPDQAHAGYIPSSWLSFVLPEDIAVDNKGKILGKKTPNTLTTELGDKIIIPVPLRSFPPNPKLLRQTATPSTKATEEGPKGDWKSQIEAAMKWDYYVELEPPKAAQDSVILQVVLNEEVGSPEIKSDTLDWVPLDKEHIRLFEALARYRYEAQALIPQSVDKKESRDPDAKPSPNISSEQIDKLNTLIQKVKTAWVDVAKFQRDERDNRTVALPTTKAADQLHEIWEFEISWDRPKKTMTLTKRSTEKVKWPEIEGYNKQPKDDKKQSKDDGTVHYTYEGEELPLLKLNWKKLFVLQYQSAHTGAYIRRNAHLAPEDAKTANKEGSDWDTNPAFIYQTELIRFSTPVVPMLNIDSSLTIKDDSLKEAITNILDTFRQSDNQYMDSLRLETKINYSFELLAHAKTVIRPSKPVFLLRATVGKHEVDNGDLVFEDDNLAADKISNRISTWHQKHSGEGNKPGLEFSWILFATKIVKGDLLLPLVRISRINLSRQDQEWWPIPETQN